MNVKHKWPWLVALLTVLLAVAAAGCGGDEEGTGTTGAGTGAGTTGAEAISVGMVSDTGGLDDRGFNEFSINGFERAKTELGVTGRVYVSESADDYLPNLTAAVDDGHDLVIAIGFLIQPSVAEVAKEATDVNFAGVDQFYGDPPECGGEGQAVCTLPNVLGL